MHTKLSNAVVLAVLINVVSGCVWASHSDVETLKKQSQNHELRLNQLESNLQAKVDEAQQKLGEIEAVLDRATRAVTRNNADLGVTVDELRNQFGALEGQIAEMRRELEKDKQGPGKDLLEKRIARLEQKVGVESASAEEAVPADKEAHWQAAEQAFAQTNYTTARTLYREFQARYNDDKRADDALVKVGDCYMAQEKPATALGEYKKVIDNYPKSDKGDVALFQMAEAFYKLKACTDAKTALQAMLKKYPRSPLAKKAKDRTKEISAAKHCAS